MGRRAKHKRYPNVFDEPPAIVCPDCGDKIIVIRTTKLTDKATLIERFCKRCDMIVPFMRGS